VLALVAHQGAREFQIGIGELPRPAANVARPAQPLSVRPIVSLADDVALELRERAHHVKNMRPLAVVVSMLSVSGRKPTLRSSRCEQCRLGGE